MAPEPRGKRSWASKRAGYARYSGRMRSAAPAKAQAARLGRSKVVTRPFRRP